MQCHGPHIVHEPISKSQSVPVLQATAHAIAELDDAVAYTTGSNLADFNVEVDMDPGRYDSAAAVYMSCACAFIQGGIRAVDKVCNVLVLAFSTPAQKMQATALKSSSTTDSQVQNCTLPFSLLT
jgi:hypothetical protein